MQDARAEPQPAVQAAHARSAEEVTGQLGADIDRGLSSREAEQRLARFGPNRLPEPKRRTLLQAFIEQFANFLILLLLAATVVAAAIGEYLDAATIGAIVILSAVLGVGQEWRAERALQALQAMMAPTSKVRRDGHVRELPAPELVPGDTVLLDVGHYVPADLRLVRGSELRLDEASLTGESTEVAKNPSAVLEEDTPVADRENCAFAGTMVTYGHGTGIVIATGAATETGRIATLIGAAERRETPLQRRMSGLGRWLGGAAIAISGVIFVAGVATGKEFVDMLLTSVSLAVAAVPEGLPAVITVGLALGVQRMARRHALVRRLAAVETLGSATVICSDKTGTLTKGEMTVLELHFGSGVAPVEVTGAGFEPVGQFMRAGEAIDPRTDRHLRLLLTAGALCNDARLDREAGEWRVVGDMTEGALAVLAAKGGLDSDELERAHPRRREAPFTSERKRMTTVHSWTDGPIAFMKGAPDVVLPLCSRRQNGDESEALSDEERERILEQNERLASNGLRVLALAYRTFDELPSAAEDLEREMTFLGLTAIRDPARPEAHEAVRRSHAAGITPIMITGDHKATAMAIARELEIAGPDGEALTGAELAKISDDELAAALEGVRVFARISPEQKVRIVEALQGRDHVVAVTGDGVNDAPALKRADIGAAMGLTGTDVAKEAADMVITDDNFASIVAAVEEGRKIFDNIRNFVIYLLGANLGEVIVVFAGVVDGLPLPLLPMQILWVNLATDALPALALSMEAGDPDSMSRPPRPPEEPLVSRPVATVLAVRGVVEGAAVLAAFLVWLKVFDVGDDEARTVAFATIVVAELLMAHGSRSLSRTVLDLGPLSNPYLVGGTLVSFGMLLAVLYVPFLQTAFHTETPGLREWLAVAGLGCVPLAVIETLKLTRFAPERRPARGAAPGTSRPP